MEAEEEFCVDFSLFGEADNGGVAGDDACLFESVDVVVDGFFLQAGSFSDGGECLAGVAIQFAEDGSFCFANIHGNLTKVTCFKFFCFFVGKSEGNDYIVLGVVGVVLAGGACWGCLVSCEQGGAVASRGGGEYVWL